MELSVVIPAFNESEVIRQTLDRVISVCKSSGKIYEIIVVDDGSTDRTREIVVELKSVHKEIRIAGYEENMGHAIALVSGLKLSLGGLVVTIDADLQDPPEYILTMLQMFEESSLSLRDLSVVQTVRSDRVSDSFFKRTSASAYYFLIKKMTGVKIRPHSADFRMMKRQVVDDIVALPEKNKILRLLIPALGVKIDYLEIRRDERAAGKTKYSIKKMLSLALDSMVSFNFRPLRLLSVLSLILAIIMLLLSVFFFVMYILYGAVPGWTSIVLLVLSSNSFVVFTLGVLGEYLGRSYEILQGRPQRKIHEF